jgi:hypothetical protein
LFVFPSKSNVLNPLCGDRPNITCENFSSTVWPSPLLALGVYCCMNAVSFVLSILFRILMLSCPTVLECSTNFDILEMSVQLLLHLNRFRVRGCDHVYAKLCVRGFFIMGATASELMKDSFRWILFKLRFLWAHCVSSVSVRSLYSI